MRILVNGDLSLQQEVFEKLKMNITAYGDNMWIVTLPEAAQIHTDVVAEHLPKDTYRQQINEYITSNDRSLKDFVTMGGRIIVSGDFQKVDEESDLPYDYVVKGNFRMYNNALITTVDFVGASQIDIADYYAFLDYMLESSTVISADSQNKIR